MAGFPCFYCTFNTQVLDSRTSGGEIRRRRACKNCGRRFTTREYVADEGVPMSKDPVVNDVINGFLSRSKKGLSKYGVGLDRGDLDTYDWLVHAQEEAMDFALYLEVLKRREEA